MTPRIVAPHPRIDAVRGCLAIERGPLVYCLEAVDAPAGTVVDDLRLTGDARAVDAPGSPRRDRRRRGRRRARAARTGGQWPYGSAGRRDGARPVELLAVPYVLWGNRGDGAMRVWIPAYQP